jgi:serine/threonine protein kinase
MQAGQILDRRYKITRKLGEGGFGTTYLAIDSTDSQIVVVKHFDPKEPLSDEFLDKVKQLFQQEAKILKDLGDTCRCIPKFHKIFEENNNLYIIQEFIDGENLKLSKIIAERDIVEMIERILTPLKCVHRANVIHQDIKPDNIRVQKNKDLFLIDFGVSRKIYTQIKKIREQDFIVENKGYTSPEQLHGEPTFASDIYAVGVIGLSAITGLDPFDLSNFPQDQTTGKIISKNVSASPQLIEFLNGALVYDLKERYANATIALEALNKLISDPNYTLLQNTKHTNQSLPNISNEPELITRITSQPTNQSSKLVLLLFGLVPFGAVGILCFIFWPKQEWKPYPISGYRLRIEKPTNWEGSSKDLNQFGNTAVAVLYPPKQSTLSCGDRLFINVTKPKPMPQTIEAYKRDINQEIDRREIIGIVTDDLNTNIIPVVSEKLLMLVLFARVRLIFLVFRGIPKLSMIIYRQ